MRLQAPPSLRSTIVPLNKDMDLEENNWRIFSCEYDDAPEMTLAAHADAQPKKKSRRSSSLIDDDELARRRTEKKQLH